MTYQEYLRSPQWKRLRRETVDAYGGRCIKCRWGDNLDVHHIKYPDRWENDSMNNLTVLCHDCHQKEHRLNPEHACVHIGGVVKDVLQKCGYRFSEEGKML